MKDVVDFKFDICIVHGLIEKEADLTAGKCRQRIGDKRKISIDSPKIV